MRFATNLAEPGDSCAACCREFEPAGHALSRDDVINPMLRIGELPPGFGITIGRKLGEGAYGKVFAGIATSGPDRGKMFAVKIQDALQRNPNDAMRANRIYTECAVLVLVGGLENIIGYLGHCTISNPPASPASPAARHHPTLADKINSDTQANFAKPVVQIMEYANTDLFKYYATGRVPAIEKVEILHEIANGLVSLHDRPKRDGRRHVIVHEDLKPENVLLDVDANGAFIPGSVKIADFGVSSSKGAREYIAGTPGYKDPLITEGIVTPALDIFSFGIMVYCAVTGGDPPFSSVSQDDTTADFEEYVLFIDNMKNEIAPPYVGFDRRDAMDLLNLAKRCVNPTAPNRPNAAECRYALQQLLAVMRNPRRAYAEHDASLQLQLQQSPPNHDFQQNRALPYHNWQNPQQHPAPNVYHPQQQHVVYNVRRARSEMTDDRQTGSSDSA